MSQINLAFHAPSNPISVAPARQVRTDTSASDLRLKVKSLWFEECRFYSTCEELAAYISSQTGVSAPVIRAWRSLYEWPVPSASGRTTWEMDDDDDPLAHAHDPLDDFYNDRRDKGHRRMLSKYLEATGFNSPSEANLSEVQDILNRHPISLWNLAIGLGQEPEIFCVYAKAKGIVEPRHAQINIPLGTLMFHHEGFATFIIRNAQHLYHHRAIPINIIANRLGLNWRDLWLLGVRFGYWRMPSPASLTTVDDFLATRPARKRCAAAVAAIKAAPGRPTARAKAKTKRTSSAKARSSSSKTVKKASSE